MEKTLPLACPAAPRTGRPARPGRSRHPASFWPTTVPGWRPLGWLAALLLLAPLAGHAQLGPVANFSTGVGSGPQGVVLADVNGDGKPDMVTANYNTQKIGVLLSTTAANATTPTFSAVVSVSPTPYNYPYNVAIADVNRDGKPDILSANYGFNSGNSSTSGPGGVDVFLNTTATGATTPSFAAAVNFPLSTKASQAVAVADVNGDGKVDMLAANFSTSGTTDVFLNTTAANATTPTFAPKVSVTTSTSANKTTDFVTTADLNGDGKPDLLVTSAEGYTVGVVLNTTATNATTATFGSLTNYSTGTSSIPAYLTAADVNGDGKPDLLASNNGTSVVGVFLNATAANATTPSFAAQVAFSTGANTGPGGIRATDLNGDGKLDVVVGLNNTGQVGVLLNSTATSATTPTFAAVALSSLGSSSAAPYDIAAGDVNGDGKPDVLAASNGTNNASVLLNQYTYPVPTITNLSPSSGVVGTSVTITGTGFTNATGVKFNGTTATYTVVSPTSITTTVPTGATTGPVTVTTASGTSSGSSFTVTVPAPTLTSISPNSGPAGSTVTLNGTNLTGAGIIKFSGAASSFVTSSYTVNAAGTQITGVVVPGGAITGDVTVNTTAGTSNGVNFTVTTTTAPTVTTAAASSITTTSATLGGNVTDDGSSTITERGVVYVAGSGTPTTTSGTKLTATGTTGSFTVSATGLTAGTQYTVRAYATNAIGTSYGSAVTFTTTAAPTLTNLNPTNGPVGTSVTLTGTNFTASSTVSFNGTAATSVTFTSATSLTAVVPTGATSGNVTVTTTGSTSGGQTFTVTVPAPALTSISPNSGPAGSTVTLNGTNLTGTYLIRFSGAIGNSVMSGYTVNAAGTQITGIVVPSAAITGEVVVSTGNNVSNGVNFTVTTAPTVTTAAASSITATSATLGGNVTADGGSTITERGVVYVAGTGTPTTSSGTKLTSTAGTGSFSLPAGSLTASTQYTVRAYAINAAGTSYGSAVTFTTLATPQALTISTGSAASPVTIAAGTYTTITVTSTGFAQLAGNVITGGAFTVNGSLDTNCFTASGNSFGSTFTLAAGATLYICDVAGLDQLGNAGPVQSYIVASFSPDASYVYNGGGAVQSTGTGLPATVRNLTIANDNNNVMLTQAVRIRQVLTVSGKGNFLLNGQALTLLSDASGTALVVNPIFSSVRGNTATVQRYIDPSLNPGAGYRHYAAPVTGSTVADLTTSGFTPVLTQGYNTSTTPGTTTPFPNVFGYDQSRLASVSNNLSAFDKGFVVPQSTDALTPGQGYAVNLDAAQLVDFQGTLGNGNLTVNLARNGGATAADAGWALVGNPYPAPLDWSQVQATDRTGLDAALYVVQSTGQYAGGYRAYVNGQSTTGTNNPLIASSQGFFVRVASGNTSGALTFRNAQRVTDYTKAQTTTFQRQLADPRPALRLTLAGNGLADGWVAYAETGANAAFDGAYDAAKLPNGHGLNLSSVAGPERLAIDGRPAFTVATVLPLAVGVPAAGSYTISAPAIDNLPAGLTAYLHDAATGQTLALTPGTSYGFSVTSAQAQALLLGRFTVQFSSGTALATAPAALAAQVQLYPNPARAQATLVVPGIAGASALRVELLNGLGQVVLRQQAALPAGGATLTLPTAGLATGVYVVRLSAGDLVLNQRLLVE